MFISVRSVLWLLATTSISCSLPVPDNIDQIGASGRLNHYSRTKINENGTLTCGNPEYVCDGIVQCAGATDEIDCSCAKRVPGYLCDKYADCPDAEDERGCEDCAANERSCFPADGSIKIACYDSSRVCDGATECEDADEGFGNCFRLVEQSDELQGPRGWRPEGYLQRNNAGSWSTVCDDTGIEGDIDVVVKELCNAVVGERSGSDSVEYSVLLSEIVSCRNNMGYFIRCATPVCHGELNEKSFGNFERGLKRVIGGSNATEGSWPSIISLRKDGEHDCGGTVLDANHVMIAAHCVRNPSNHRYDISAGVYRRSTFSPTVQTVQVSEIIPHPDFPGRFLQNDIAILVLKTPLLLNKWVKPACLPESGSLLDSLHECAVAGWGYTMNRTRTVDILQHALLPATSMTQCQELIGDRRIPRPEQVICAGYEEGGVDACTGDSGGPLLCLACQRRGTLIDCNLNKWVQEGIVSFGIGCAERGVPGVYTSVRYYLPWIHTVLDSSVPYVGKRLTASAVDSVHVCNSPYSPPISVEKVCDGKVDCLDGDDEIGYPECVNHPRTTLPSPSGNTYHPKAPLTTVSVPVITTLPLFETEEKCPNSFRCTETVPLQCVPMFEKCNGSPKCRDGSDELHCSCLQRLIATNLGVLCDGVPDCSDTSDEGSICNLCKPGWSKCHESRQCVPEKMICDDRRDCTFGEDEIGCIALATNGNEVLIDSDDAPLRLSEGFLCTRDGNMDHFSPVCTDNLESDLMDTVCHHLGFQKVVNIEYIDAPATTTYNISYAHGRSTQNVISTKRSINSLKIRDRTASTVGQHNVRHAVSKLKTDYGNVTTVFNRTSDNDQSNYVIANIRNKRQVSTTSQDRCTQVMVTCGALRCGIVPRVARSSSNYTGFGSQPWAVGVYVDGNYVCGGTLVNLQWVIADGSCIEKHRRGSASLYVVGGSYRGLISSMRVKGPFEREAAVQYVHLVTEAVSVMRLLHPLQTNSYINPLCMPQRSPSWPGPWKVCAITGSDGEVLANHTTLIPSDEDCPIHQACFKPYSENNCQGVKSGLIACLNSTEPSAQWVAVALWQNIEQSEDCSRPNSHFLLNDTLLTTLRAIMVLPTPSVIVPCSGLTCPFGKCLPQSKVCDGRPDCADFADEPDNCPTKSTRCKNVLAPVVCECSAGERPCWNGSCLAANRFCDGAEDCAQGEDEQRCCEALLSQHPEMACDGRVDCTDGGDEIGCGCDSGYRCYSNNTGTGNTICLPMEAVCDRTRHCPGKEDESHCSVLLALPPNLSPLLPIDTRQLGIPLNALGNAKPSSSGLFMLRYHGSWYTYFHNGWRTKLSTQICLNLGFNEAITSGRNLLTEFESKETASARSIVGVRSSTTSRNNETSHDGSFSIKVVYIECINS